MTISKVAKESTVNTEAKVVQDADEKHKTNANKTPTEPHIDSFYAKTKFVNPNPYSRESLFAPKYVAFLVPACPG